MLIAIIDFLQIPPRRQQRGFTAIELMVVVAIVAVLMAMAAPSFNGLMERWRVKQGIGGMQSAIFLARSEAIKRGGNVVIQKTANNTNGCTLALTTAEWGCGWYICVDSNSNNTCNASEEVIQRFEPVARIEVQRSTAGESVTFNRWGMPTGGFGFSMSPQGKSYSDISSRGLCVSSGGRINVIESTTCPTSF